MEVDIEGLLEDVKAGDRAGRGGSSMKGLAGKGDHETNKKGELDIEQEDEKEEEEQKEERRQRTLAAIGLPAGEARRKVLEKNTGR